MNQRYFENAPQTEAMVIVDNDKIHTVQWVKNGMTHLLWKQRSELDGSKTTIECTGALADLLTLHNVVSPDLERRLEDVVIEMQIILEEKTIIDIDFLHAPKPSEGNFSL